MSARHLPSRLAAATALAAVCLLWRPAASGNGASRGRARHCISSMTAAAAAGRGAATTLAPAHAAVQRRHPPAAAPRSPVAGLDASELDRLLRERPARLGSASIGRPSRGGLWGGVQLQSGAHLAVHSPVNAWGTAATVAAIEHAAAEVAARYPGTPKLGVGDISRRRGGYLRPHRSHQSGLDVDVGYYYLGGESWYLPATAANLDRKRTWAFIEALARNADLDTIFIDRRVQALLREYVEAQGGDAERVEAMFASRMRPHGLIRHTWGHRTHMHVRLHDEAARTTARRLYPLLRKLGKL